MSRLLSGEIVRETLPNNAKRYNGAVEEDDTNRFRHFIESTRAKDLFTSLKAPYIPDACETLHLEVLV